VVLYYSSAMLSMLEVVTLLIDLGDNFQLLKNYLGGTFSPSMQCDILNCTMSFRRITTLLEIAFNCSSSQIGLTPKGPRVFWCKTTQNYPLLKKEPVILF
jgi:hypothetical protein